MTTATAPEPVQPQTTARGLLEMLDGPTLARVIEACQLHAHTLDRLDGRVGDGSLGDDATMLRVAAGRFAEINAVRVVVAPHTQK